MPIRPSRSLILRRARLLRRLSIWLEQAGIDNGTLRATLAIDLADSIHAAQEIEQAVRRMLREKPDTKRGADKALGETGIIDALAFTELWDHLRGLKKHWESRLM